MNRPDLYNKTVDILYQAYFNDTLRHGNCHACAVGNIIAANMGFKYRPFECPFSGSTIVFNIKTYDMHWVVAKGGRHSKGWPTSFYTSGGYQVRGTADEAAKIQIKATGYLIKELAQIEFAFETADKGSSPEDRMFNGLVAVLNVLAQIHDVTDADLLSSNSKRFSDHYKTLSPCPATNAII